MWEGERVHLIGVNTKFTLSSSKNGVGVSLPPSVSGPEKAVVVTGVKELALQRGQS